MKAWVHIGWVAVCLLAPLPALGQEAWLSVTDAGGSWCRYPTEKAWRAESSEDSAHVTWKGSGAVTVHLQWSSRTGDWAAGDVYRFEGDDVIELKRVYNALYEGPISLQETWTFYGAWERTKRALLDLNTKKPVPDDGTWSNPIDKYRSLGAFPFYRLLDESRVTEKTCM